MSTILEDVKDTVDQVLHRLPVFLIETPMPFFKVRKTSLSKKWTELLEAEKKDELAKMYPKEKNPRASQFVTREMLEEAVFARADAEGNFLTTQDGRYLTEEAAKFILKKAKVANRRSRLHPCSKLFDEDIKAAKEERVAAASKKEDSKKEKQ